MNGYNRVILAGNLTRDPELRYTPKGTAVAKMGLALNRTWKDEAGALHEECTFVDIDAFGKQAETISQYLKKGRQILIEGRLKLDQWDDKQTNQKRQRLGVILESFTFIDSGKADSAAPAGQPASKRGKPAGKAKKANGDPLPPDTQDDVPF
jgi:single-strand DNA-binding protein